MADNKYWKRTILIGSAVAVVVSLIQRDAAAAAGEKKSPLPSAADQEKVAGQLEEIYGLSKKRTDAENLHLAKELFGLSKNSRGKPAEQFVLARKAMELARDGGDAIFMLQAIDFLGARFEMNALVVKGKMLRSFAEGAVDKRRIESLVKASQRYVAEALAARQYDFALSVATLTYATCQRPAGREFRKPLLDLRQRVQKLRDEHEKFENATLAVKADPDDREAHLTLGRLYCFSRGDWQRGMPHLTNGSDAELASLAEQDLAVPDDPKGQVKLGDAWWSLAEAQEGEEKNVVMLRAGFWYKKAQSELSGLNKTKVTKRLAKIAEIRRPAATTPGAEPVPSWPGKVPGLVMAWKRGFGAEKVVSSMAGPAHKWRLEPRGAAKPDARGGMELAKGACIVHGGNELLLAACMKTNQLTVEAVLNAANLEQDGPARIISFSTDGHHRNFTLGQSADRLVFRLRTPRTGTNGSSPETALCRFTAGVPHHIIVSYRPGQLVCYFNGQQVLATPKVQGDFSNWSSQQLLFGDEYKDRRDWSGTLDLVAISDRFVDAAEAQRRFRAAQAAMKEPTGRKP